MATVEIRLKFDMLPNPPVEFSETLVLPKTPAREGVVLLSAQLTAELKKELYLSKFYDALPRVEPFEHGGTVPIAPATTDEEAARHNTEAVWFEISNTFLEARLLLAQSRA